MSKTQIPIRYRTCNCPRVLVNGKLFHMEDGIMRALLELNNPDWKHVPKSPEPCPHWEQGVATVLTEGETDGR